MARDPLFSRLPEIWKVLDQVENVVDEKGILQRYLEVWDDSLDLSHTDASGVLDTRNINKTPDRYLKLIGELVGHRWRDYRSYQWNRQRIRESIAKYSYKGTYLAISDLAHEHGATYCEVIDNASLVDVWNIQYGMFFDSDFFHPGVFQLIVSDDIDLEHFTEDFEYLKAGGTKWVIKIIPSSTLGVTEYNAAGSPKILPQNVWSEDGMWWWDWMPMPPVEPVFEYENTGIAYLGAGLYMDSLTFFWDGGTIVFSDEFVPTEYTYNQPLVDIDIPT